MPNLGVPKFSRRARRREPINFHVLRALFSVAVVLHTYPVPESQLKGLSS
jgi:hypothetical protein